MHLHKRLITLESGCFTELCKSSSVKVRRLHVHRDSGAQAMASSGRERRRKRPWRQPRQTAGYPSSASASASAGGRSSGTCSTALESTTSGSTSSTTNTSAVTKVAADIATEEEKHPQTNEHDKQPVSEGGEAGIRGLEEAAVEEKTGDGRDGGVETGGCGGGGSVGMVELDGSVMEGGGQILRNAVSLSCLVGRPVRLTRVRAGRSKPGLRPQHLAGLQLIGQLCGGKLAGDSVNSTTVELCPGSVRNGDYSADTQTAGSTCLLLQVSLPCLLFAPLNSSSTLTLRGGTDADMAPPIDYIIKVFKPTAAKFGVEFECEKKRRGFYPRGGGEVVVKPHPVHHLTPATITEPGHVVSVSVHAYVAGTVPEKTAHQLAQSARQQVEKQLPGVAIEISEVHETAASAYGSGSGIIVVAETSTGCLLGGSANGKKGEPPYKTGRAAADQLLKAVKEGACVDDQLQDQLIIFMALAKGQSVIRTGALSLHTKTAIHTARALTPAVFNVRKLEGGAHLIECDGMGLENIL